ncbi:hypothetical protein SETIT_1G209400v2 [Setaria italica]|uniref:Uncharacterized protein n=1 Tax=Setaria italica TaxID=4555 RepID=A0A368PMK0_SETIT|nr:hypothetical protein SETIT_1G209400v2 [Setaria italica]
MEFWTQQTRCQNLSWAVPSKLSRPVCCQRHLGCKSWAGLTSGTEKRLIPKIHWYMVYSSTHSSKPGFTLACIYLPDYVILCLGAPLITGNQRVCM